MLRPALSYVRPWLLTLQPQNFRQHDPRTSTNYKTRYCKSFTTWHRYVLKQRLKRHLRKCARLYVSEQSSYWHQLIHRKVLDFPRYPEWHTTVISSISTIPPSKNAQELLPGEALDVEFGGVRFVPVVKTNTSTEFAWNGSVFGGAFAGKHYFQFLESQTTPGGTTFVHGEDYDGWMSWLFREGAIGFGRRNAVDMYENVSKDVKNRAEELKKLRQGVSETAE
jgi:hypothetical protein